MQGWCALPSPVLHRCAKYFVALGVKKENLLAVDVKVRQDQQTLLVACNPTPCMRMQSL